MRFESGEQPPLVGPTTGARGRQTSQIPKTLLLVGVVEYVNPNTRTCEVSITPDSEDSTPNLFDVPWAEGITFGGAGGTNGLPTPGSLAIVANIPNYWPMIIGFARGHLPGAVFSELEDKLYEESFKKAEFSYPPEEFATGGKSPFYAPDTYRRPVDSSGLAPKDLHFGDYELRSYDNERVGVYRGGLIRIFAGNLAQTMYFRFRNLIRSISRRWELWTDWGKITIGSESSGGTSMDVRAGSDFKTETHPRLEKWRIRFHAGGDPIVSLLITDPKADPPREALEGEELPPVDIINPDEEYLKGPEDALYWNYIFKDGNRDEYSKQNIKKVAELKISEESLQDNIEETAKIDILEKAGKNIKQEATELNIEEIAGTDIISKAGANISRTAEVNIDVLSNTGNITRTATVGNITDTAAAANITTTAGQLSSHTAGTLYNITAGTAANIAGGSLATVSASAIVLGGATLVAGPSVILSSGSGMPGINGMTMITKFNSHTHSVSGVTSSPPDQQLDPQGDVTLSKIN